MIGPVICRGGPYDGMPMTCDFRRQPHGIHIVKVEVGGERTTHRYRVVSAAKLAVRVPVVEGGGLVVYTIEPKHSGAFYDGHYKPKRYETATDKRAEKAEKR